MPGIERKSLNTPDETRTPPKAKAEVVRLGTGTTILRTTLEPGWKWSEHVKPTAGTASCTAAHTGYLVSGRFHCRLDDGSEAEFGPGDALFMPPGHDAWVVGTEPVVMVDFTGGEEVSRYLQH